MSETKYERTQWFNPALSDYRKGQPAGEEVMVPCVPALPGLESVRPNLISSRLYTPDEPSPHGVMHSPVLDLDYEARLVPSTTEGHYHLLLDGLRMEWPAYARFLRGMAYYGLIEEDYYRASVRRRMSCARPEGVKKEAA